MNIQASVLGTVRHQAMAQISRVPSFYKTPKAVHIHESRNRKGVIVTGN
jgi:hypothetical protein